MPTTTEEHTITFEIVCTNLPGLEWNGRGPIHLGLQEGDQFVQGVPANRKRAVFRPALRVRKHTDGSANFLGPFAHGPRSNRFIYLIWAIVNEQAGGAMLGRIKLLLSHIRWTDVERALAAQRPIQVTLALTDEKGRPVFASVRPDRAEWVLLGRHKNLTLERE